MFRIAVSSAVNGGRSAAPALPASVHEPKYHRALQMQSIPLKHMPAATLHSGEGGSVFCSRTDAGRHPDKILDAPLNLASQRTINNLSMPQIVTWDMLTLKNYVLFI